jgi:hypothetical protein
MRIAGSATRRVLASPAASAQSALSVESKGSRLSPMPKPAGSSRKSKPLRMPRSRMLAAVASSSHHSSRQQSARRSAT